MRRARGGEGVGDGAQRSLASNKTSSTEKKPLFHYDEDDPRKIRGLHLQTTFRTVALVKRDEKRLGASIEITAMLVSDMSITQTSVQGGATMSEHVAWCSNYEISTTGYQLSHRVNHRFRKEERGAGNGRKREHSPMMLEYFDKGATLYRSSTLRPLCSPAKRAGVDQFPHLQQTRKATDG
ncbi:predicted protein [Histoplasma capsulatum var. duboisii H88]|uniref:Predicted protein n=1 Tax=Ajellomyces capsulatus (strain H88) TaxID=544711 RepID=F0UVK4_AJEC8|nr:predicted protein [Histoplasma capsulatum var. duboisii H88]